MALFEQLGKKITDASHGVVKQTRNLTDTTRLNAKISENKKKMSQLLFEMGNDYYKKHRKDQDCEEQEYIDQLNVLFHEILRYQKEIEEIMVEIDEEIGIKLKAGIGRGKNAEDAAYMADIGLEEIRANNNEMWTWVIEKEY